MKIGEMSPQDHVERAEALMQMLDDRYDETGRLRAQSGAGWTITPVQLTLADLHIGLAMVKLDSDFR